MSDFAINEIKIAKANSNDSYYNACLDAAYEAYKVIENQGHTGASISITMRILNRLVNSKPLSLIEDTPDVWCDVTTYMGGHPTYQCTRYSGLFKDITDTGTTYSDVHRFVCYEIDKPDIPFTSVLVNHKLNEQFPISMPYYPETWKVYVKEFLSNPANGDFDTVHIIRAVKPNGEEIIINRYFTEENNKFVEISADKYSELLDKHKEEVK